MIDRRLHPLVLSLAMLVSCVDGADEPKDDALSETESGLTTSLCTTSPRSSALAGWASVAGMGLSKTTGGANGTVKTVSTLKALQDALAGTAPTIVQVQTTIPPGDIVVGSNKTLVGLCGGKIQGRLLMKRSANVIVRNLRIVGNNCRDSPDDCQKGKDAVSVDEGSHHIWFDHDDISDGSDGNLDITNGSDFITISWTKFKYSTGRADAVEPGGHRFSSLIGNSDTKAAIDAGHLRVTLHHNHWAEDVDRRMPYVRFGRVHVYNNLFTSAGNHACIQLGVDANIREEANTFVNVGDPLEIHDLSNAASVLESIGSVFRNTRGNTVGTGGRAFVPPYTYRVDAAAKAEADVRAGVGPG